MLISKCLCARLNDNGNDDVKIIIDDKAEDYNDSDKTQ